MTDEIEYFKWDEDVFEFVPCEPDDPEADPFIWNEDTTEWEYCGEED